MEEKLKQVENLDFWEMRTNKYDGHNVSWWDINMKKIEIANIVPYLFKNDLVLDIGCSNGASTLEIYNAVGCRIDGIDYSLNAIEQAKKIKINDLSFRHEDISQFVSKIKYDKAYSIRCLINIMSKKSQKQTLVNIYDSLKDNGMYIMAEAFKGGLKNLNRVRRVFGLKELAEPKYNNYFEESEFEKFISKYFEIAEVKKYASLYYLGTRLFQYLAMDEEPKESDTELHRFFANFGYETRNSGDFSPQKIYVLKKK